MINLLGKCNKIYCKGTINVSVSLLNERKKNVTVEIKLPIQELGFLQLKLYPF
jgi:hypothetical protein